MYIHEFNEITLVKTRNAKRGKSRKLLRRLGKGDAFQVHGCAVTSAYGLTVTAVARWRRPLHITDGERHWRFSRLEVMYGGSAYLFTIPAAQMEKPLTLPSLAFNAGEINMLRQMADELRSSGDCVEKTDHIKMPEKVELKAARAVAQQLPYAPSDVLEVMEENPWAAELLLAATLANLRPWFGQTAAPNLVVNVVIPSRNSDGSALDALRKVLQSFAFLGDADGGFLAEREMNRMQDISAWLESNSQIALLHCSAEVSDRIRQQAENTPAGQRAFSSYPLLCVNSEAIGSCVDNIFLPSRCTPCTVAQQDALRRMMALLLEEPKAMVGQILSNRRQLLAMPEAYRKSYVTSWREAVRTAIITREPQLSDVMEDSAAKAELLQAERAGKLRRGIELITNTEKYKAEIGIFPPSKREATELLSTEFVCLAHRVKGTDLLVFSKDSMLRLLLRTGVDETYLELVFQKLDRLGVLRNRRDSLHFKEGGNGRFITMFAEKL